MLNGYPPEYAVICDRSPEPPNKSTKTELSGYSFNTSLNFCANILFCPTNGNGADKYSVFIFFVFDHDTKFLNDHVKHKK